MTPLPPQRIQDTLVDVLEHVKDTELMLGFGPQLGQEFRIQVRAIGDDHLGSKPPVLEILEETPHVVVVVGTDQGKGDGNIAQRVGSHEQGPVPEMDFVDAQGAGETLQGPLAVGGQVDLADLPIEAVVDKALGEIELEIAAHRFAQPLHTHAVVEQTVEDRLADPIAVFGTGLDAFDPRSEGLATRATGAVFSDGDFEDEDLLKGDIADGAGVRTLPPSPLATVRARVGFRGAPKLDHANAGLKSIHACVPPGLES